MKQSFKKTARRGSPAKAKRVERAARRAVDVFVAIPKGIYYVPQELSVMMRRLKSALDDARAREVSRQPSARRNSVR